MNRALLYTYDLIIRVSIELDMKPTFAPVDELDLDLEGNVENNEVICGWFLIVFIDLPVSFCLSAAVLKDRWRIAADLSSP